ncbi:hypothetical protein KUTeg_024976 [Tegillarca granosa]|uniref:Uncharacterized protein n=1 Tax=Tegillarca granosa TaxID=220873 RepID=A0ABQ9DZV5_TEGGR|nr:hypothetical protein KUTeg_024976 [Tegillarca granosa]
MPVAQVVNGNMPQLPPPAVVPKNVNPSIRPTNPVLAPFPVQCNGNPVPSELLIPPRPELRLPIPHSQGYVMSPDTVPMVTNTMMLQQPPVLPPPFQSNPPHMPPSPATHAPQYSSNQPPPPPSSSVSVTSPCNQVTPAGNGQMYPCIWVPYMDSISLGQVDVNAPPSKEISGVDLPMTGKHYRSISQLSFSLAKETSSIGQSPVVYCQSKIPNEVKFVTPPNCTSSKDVNSLVSEKNSDNSPVPESSKESESHLNMAATEMDEKGSMSSDSGCESLTGCNVNESKGNDENSKDHISKDIINESVLEKITTSSDMSISDTNDGAISLADSQDQVTKTTKPRRKYYMYEKSRVEGEPIILSPPTMPPSFAPGSSYATQSTGTVYFADKAYPGDLNTYGTPFVAPVTPGLECGTSQPQAALPPPPPPPALAYSISHQVSAQMALAAPPQ